MKGTDKQIRWADEIRSSIASRLPDMSSNPIADKAKQYVLAIDRAEFWIGHKDVDPITLLRMMLTGDGLEVGGSYQRIRAKLDPKTGTITQKYSDGRVVTV